MDNTERLKLCDEAIELAEKATEAPWVIEDDGYDLHIYVDEDDPGTMYVAREVNQPGGRDATFIAASRSLVPSLVTQLREVVEENERVKAKAGALDDLLEWLDKDPTKMPNETCGDIAAELREQIAKQEERQDG